MNNTHRARRLALALTGACLLTPWAASAQAPAWPSKPVTLIVGTPPGGAIDAYARALAQQLGKVTGGTFLVDYKPGANGNISAEFVQKAQPDGHTLWIGTQAMMTINPSVYPNQRWQQAGFKPIAKGVEAPLVLVTHPSVPARTLAELVKWAAANPGKAAYASFSPGTPSQFLGYQLNQRFKLDMTHIPYKGSGPQTTDLLGGQVPLGFAQLQSVIPHVQSGKLNAIAVTSPQRSRHLPQVPTLAELGYKELNTTIWFGLLAPAAAPKAVLDAIAAATQKAQADADYKARLEAQGFDVPQEYGDAFAATIAMETARWAEVVRATGFKAND
ncbi:MAG: tripartite tricarboxylate transporter substrate binding protein [Hylemonella sp.]|nr:tripartite tricarboxylate transporter substrate binding protein [Hylemonella sp.]